MPLELAPLDILVTLLSHISVLPACMLQVIYSLQTDHMHIPFIPRTGGGLHSQCRWQNPEGRGPWDHRLPA